MDKENKIIVFENRKIRRLWHDGEWYFSVVDIIVALTASSNPRNYWNMLKKREAEHGIELSTFCVQLKLEAPDRKLRETDCANTESLFRIIQSIPSKKAEPFKRWLAKRVRGIAVRQELTDEWKQRGMTKSLAFAILTNEISEATFGKTVEEYRHFKGLERENLRDHMDNLEIIFTMPKKIEYFLGPKNFVF